MSKLRKPQDTGSLRRILRPLLGCLLVAGLVAGLNGCTRRYFRKAADKEVADVLAEKDQYPPWKIEQYHVYPDPRSRFADPTNPDRPPKPPDDPAAYDLSPNPQKPGKAGVARIEGAGYLELLAAWDAMNRAAQEETLPGSLAPAGSGYPDTPSSSGPPAASSPNEPQAYLLNLDQAVELGLINSREFQDRREDLYLASLPVTLGRFAFSAQFFATEQFIRERTGRRRPEGQGNRIRANSDVGVAKLFSTGALLLVRFANQTVIELSGFGRRPLPRHTISQSTLSLDFIQPLLRGGGKAVTLEPLTQVERNLLYEIRDYARFRKEFFVAIAAGGDIRPIPLGALGLGGSALTIPELIGTGAVAANLAVRPGGSGRLNLNVAPGALTEGYLPNLLIQSQLANERRNVTNLQDYFRRFQAFRDAPPAGTGTDITQLQVDQVEQNLLNGRSTVLQRQQDYRDSIDRFKLQLGMPVNIPLVLDDDPVRPLVRQLQSFDEILDQFQKARDDAARQDAIEEGVGAFSMVQTLNPLLATPAGLASALRLNVGEIAPGFLSRELRPRFRRIATTSPLVQGTRFRTEFPRRWTEVEKLTDKQLFDLLDKLLKERDALVHRQRELERENKTLPPAETRRLTELRFEIELVVFERALRLFEKQEWKNEPDLAKRLFAYALQVQAAISSFQQILTEARNERIEQVLQNWPDVPNVCVGGVDLLKADLEAAQTVVAQTALINRFDLMNERARLVDSWRQITVFANALLGGLTVEYHLNSLTPPGMAKPLAFSGSATRHQLVVNSELPLVRLPERNNYRAVLIAYQRQRRALMAAEDGIAATVRQEIRQLRQLAENYRIQQRQVVLGYRTVENSLEALFGPPIPAGAGGGAAGAAALTQQLLSAQSSLLRSQNQLYATWLNYLITRLQLYRDLELMPLDLRGVWIDEHATNDCGARGSDGPAGLRLPESGIQRPDGDVGGERPERLPEPHVKPPAR